MVLGISGAIMRLSQSKNVWPSVVTSVYVFPPSTLIYAGIVPIIVPSSVYPP